MTSIEKRAEVEAVVRQELRPLEKALQHRDRAAARRALRSGVEAIRSRFDDWFAPPDTRTAVAKLFGALRRD